jgi:hypothetical protein
MRRALATILLSASACATTAPASGPRGMRASDHLEAAREHSDAAANRNRWPDTRPDATAAVARADEPRWLTYWSSDEDARLAEMHRSAAARIEEEYQTACGDAPAADVSVSPLVRYGLGGTRILDGAVVYLSKDAGTPDQVMAKMRCHRAWMMLGRSAMDDCPLDLPQIEMVAHETSGAIEVEITTRNTSQVEELQRRVAKDVEAGASRTLHAAPR